ncbi:AmmeMemoRadiSam system radical SAM enzyme [Sulfurospirillum diekertiae]|uniref:AmmeMemoRadiSam system radical SAM enzyme n=1 Tax=Sulfurospirillum diekertiae TaxID=1854492 RepID=A0A1Y0HI30_9BACT|nr:AmmeMemoRadiSam system radical SAM enzyme [Sulfurospirillum diekertiae]ARU47226.1 AmmeMemoRadiSam system radical SAM enzyme [Sulfurospirillum diekertiae]ASC92080.1 AmmeMemoRadiSam system radical SAM enzyme [Sulfurospirillum diekertiae]
MHYFKTEGSRLVCLLCAHYCHLKEGQIGICGVNQNVDGTIKNLVYGHPVAMHIDPVEKKPLYHFLPDTRAFSIGTIGCNFKCPFCQNWSISQEKSLHVKEYFAPQQIIEMALKYECASIAYTYNEPTIFYPYAKDIAILAHEKGMKNIFVTNGFESSEVIDDMVGIIDAANIDLKSFNHDYYKKELGGGLETILENLKHFKRNGIWIEVTTLIVPTKNDSDEELNSIASFIAKELGEQTPWHISAFHPDYHEQGLPSTSIETLKRAETLGKNAGLKHIYIGNVGLENPTRCVTCNAVLITRKRFEVTENYLVDGCCPKCNTKLTGVFDE